MNEIDEKWTINLKKNEIFCVILNDQKETNEMGFQERWMSKWKKANVKAGFFIFSCFFSIVFAHKTQHTAVK